MSSSYPHVRLCGNMHKHNAKITKERQKQQGKDMCSCTKQECIAYEVTAKQKQVKNAIQLD